MALLLAVVYLAVVLFATGYFALATSTEDQFVDLDTKTDALYLTMTTLSTVGYGDVHAAGQAARAIVTVQIVFNLVVIGALASVFTTRLRQRAARPPSGTRGRLTSSPPTAAIETRCVNMVAALFHAEGLSETDASSATLATAAMPSNPV